ncbi:MAG: HlyD family efflux transporter periplasmic adaptor subunit, partial [Planctomycetota bacterium]
GVLLIDDESVAVVFRVRRVTGDTVKLGFYDLPIKTREQITRLRKQVRERGKYDLHGLSYDDLASGGKKTKAKTPSTHPKAASTVKKLLAMTVLAASMLLVIGWVAFLVQSRSTVTVNNSVINGNYMPVNTPQQGQLTEVLVQPGTQVQRGDILARLSNDEAEFDLALVQSKLTRARAEAAAYRVEADSVESMFAFTQQKVIRDLQVANAELQSARAQVQAAQAQLSRLEPLLARGNVPLAEVDEAKALLAAAQAEQLRQKAVIETLTFAQEAAADHVLVSEDGATDPLSELNTKIALADAAIAELEATQRVLSDLAQPVELQSPSDGTVYAVYHGEGETLKVAEQTLAISANDGGWATGHVAAELAPEIRPGQPVEVEIPSLGISTTGTVEGIGHRSVYGNGGYNADFRGGPLEVPIRVAINLNGQPVPSGLRLHMTVRVRDHLKDLKSWVNQKIATYWNTTTPDNPTGQPSPPSDSDDVSGPMQVALSR